MSEKPKCEVCNGMGDYPIIDNFGTTRYNITCPECFGSGDADDDTDEPPPESDLPPASSAAFIKAVEQMREHIERNWPRTPQDTGVAP